ncbi:MAG TPA: AIM24 family protein, partial [Herpetosiphonaceae bacterium]|nr:AIM24 family protein [Herpetosiphonaceae bacterium]
TYTCPWCNTVSDGTRLTCPGCSISIDVRNIVTDSGWIELPGRRDMTKLQFGNSYCQIEGSYVPVADFNLAPEDQVYFAHHVLLWMDPQVKIGAMGLKGAWKRMLAGMPLIMTQAQGPGHIAFSRDAPGELIALPLQPGQGVDVREHIFLVATSHVTYDWFQTNIWFTTKNGDDTETHYPLGVFMDRFVAPQAPGLLLLHASGNAFIRLLAPGETILVQPPALLFKDPMVRMQLHIEYPGTNTWAPWRSWSHRHLWLRLYGPGRVAVQSAYEPMEENGRNITGHSGATQQQW